MPQRKNPAPGVTGDGAAFGMRGSVECGLTNLRNQAQQRLRRQHLARRAHALGDRVFFEFVDEFARVHGLGDDLDRRLEKYSTLDPELVLALGAGQFPSSPVRLVGGTR